MKSDKSDILHVNNGHGIGYITWGLCNFRPLALALNLYLPALALNLYLPALAHNLRLPVLAPNLYLLALAYNYITSPGPAFTYTDLVFSICIIGPRPKLTLTLL